MTSYQTPILGNKMQGSLAMAQGGSLEVAVGDITKPNSLKAEMFQGVQAVICCTAVKVSPKEGDNASRDKYNQVIRQAHAVLEANLSNISEACAATVYTLCSCNYKWSAYYQELQV